jgi:nucleotide-binding universal stress UspA family protein
MPRLFLPVLTYPTPTAFAGLLRALDLAATLQGEVSATIVEVDIPPVSAPLVPMGVDVTAMSMEAEAVSRRQANEAAAHLRNEARRIGLTIAVDRIRRRQEWAGTALASAARSQDLTLLVMGDSDDERRVAEALIFESGGPVVLIPGAGETPTHLSTVAVAWDDSAASARALRDAMPLLEAAGRVVLVTADADKKIDPKSIERALAALDHRGIQNSHLEVLVESGQSIGDALQQAALRKDAGLLVMGAFGHSRIREFILGGATRSVLGKLQMAILMSH